MWLLNNMMESSNTLNDEKTNELRRRFYMLLRNGWRQMTQIEKRLLGRMALEYEYICPIKWDVDSETFMSDLAQERRDEFIRDRQRIESSGGTWIEIKN